MTIIKTNKGWKVKNTSGVSKTKKAAKRRLRAIEWSKKRRKRRINTQENTMSLKFLGSEAACGTSVGAASTFQNAMDVRLVNNGTTNRLVTIANAADTTLATFTLAAGEVSIVRKKTDDQIFAAHAEVLGAPVVTEN